MKKTRTDTDAAQIFAADAGPDLRHVTSWGKRGWMVWDGKRWKRDNTDAVRRMAHKTARGIAAESMQIEDAKEAEAQFKWGHKLLHTQSINNLLREAQALLATSPDQWDNDPDCINTETGPVYLTKQRMDAVDLPPYPQFACGDHQRSQYHTRLAPVEWVPGAKCPCFDAFLERIFDGNQELISYLWRAIGYGCLTGRTDEQCMFIAWGQGANGKTVLFNTLARLAGEYWMQTPTEMLMRKRHQGVPNDIARLKGARFVTATETNDGSFIDEALVKQITGGDTVSARFMRGEWFDFTPQFKVWMATNSRPQIVGRDNGIWRRIHLIPFNVVIPKEEQVPRSELEAQLAAELPGILYRAVQGALEWSDGGLRPPAVVLQAVDAYRVEMDTLGDFLDTECHVVDGMRAKAAQLYEAYKRWATDGGERVESQRKFKAAMEARGFRQTRSGANGSRQWDGIGLRADVN